MVRPGEPVDLVPGLTEEARERLDLPVPEIRTSPPAGVGELPVGLPVWFWVDDFGSREETASVGDVWVRAEAVPVGMVLRVREPWVEDGRRTVRETRIDCGGPGTAFDAGRHDPWSSSDCSHAFTWAGGAEVDVEVVWDLSWTASTGAGGDLGRVERHASVGLDLIGFEAVTH